MDVGTEDMDSCLSQAHKYEVNCFKYDLTSANQFHFPWCQQAGSGYIQQV